MNKLDSVSSYRHWVRAIRFRNFFRGRHRAMEQAVGGSFDAFGVLMKALLIHYGLTPMDYLIDVGCGSGRLAKPLSEYLTDGAYLGFDVVPDLVEHARASVPAKNFEFQVSTGYRIPEKDGKVNWVVFFSVFTHLLHEHSYRYLEEAKRVLRPGGTILFSYLDFRIPSHWAVFDSNLRDLENTRSHLNMFMGRDLIASFTEHLGLELIDDQDGSKPHFPIPEKVVTAHGVMDKMGCLGQSVCVLRKPVLAG